MRSWKSALFVSLLTFTACGDDSLEGLGQEGGASQPQCANGCDVTPGGNPGGGGDPGGNPGGGDPTGDPGGSGGGTPRPLNVGGLWNIFAGMHIY